MKRFLVGRGLAATALLLGGLLAAPALAGATTVGTRAPAAASPRVVIGPPGGGACSGSFVNVMFQSLQSDGQMTSESWCEDGQIAANPPGPVDNIDNQSNERFWVKGTVWLLDSNEDPYTAPVDVCISPGMDWIFDDVIDSPDVGTGAAAACPSNTWPSSPSNYGVGEQWYLNDCPNSYLNTGGRDFIMVTQEIGRSIGVQPYCYPDTPASYAGTSDVVPVWAMANGTQYRVWVENSAKQTYCISPFTVVQLVPTAFEYPISVGV